MAGGFMKKILARVMVGITIIVIIFCPFLLAVDFERYLPFVLMIWFLSFIYYLVMKKRIQNYLDSRETEKKQNS